jgi:uncharacterized protein YacL
MKGFTGLILGLLIGNVIGLVISNFNCMSKSDWIFAIGSLIVFCIINYFILESEDEK